MRLPFLLALLGFALSVCTSGAAFATPIQDSPAADSPPAAAGQHVADPQRQAEHLARKLQLTPQQTAAIEPILDSRAQQMQHLRADTSMDPRTRRSQMRALKQNTEQQLQAVLNDSQRQQYQQMQQQAKQRHHAGQAPGGSGADSP